MEKQYYSFIFAVAGGTCALTMGGPLVSQGKEMFCHGDGHAAFRSKGCLDCILPCQSHSLTLAHVSHSGVSWVYFFRQSKSDDEVCRQITACFSCSK